MGGGIFRRRKGEGEARREVGDPCAYKTVSWKTISKKQKLKKEEEEREEAAL